MSALELLQKARVLVTNLLTWLLVLQTGLTAVVASGQLDQFPEVARWVLIVLTGVGVVITFIRRVTPVPPEQRGLLPK